MPSPSTCSSQRRRDPDQDAALESALRDAGNVVLGSSVGDHRGSALQARRRSRSRTSRSPRPRPRRAASNLPTDPRRRDPLRVTGARRATRASRWPRTRWRPATRRSATARRALLDYYGPPRTIKTVSIYQALDPKKYLPPGFFKDKIVFVGASAGRRAGPRPERRLPDALSRRARPDDLRRRDSRDARGEPARAPPRSSSSIRGSRRRCCSCFPLVASLDVHDAAAARRGRRVRRPARRALDAGVLRVRALGPVGPRRDPVGDPAARLLRPEPASGTTSPPCATARRSSARSGLYLSPEMIRRIAEDPDAVNLGGQEIVGHGDVHRHQGVHDDRRDDERREHRCDAERLFLRRHPARLRRGRHADQVHRRRGLRDLGGADPPGRSRDPGVPRGARAGARAGVRGSRTRGPPSASRRASASTPARCSWGTSARRSDSTTRRSAMPSTSPPASRG